MSLSDSLTMVVSRQHVGVLHISALALGRGHLSGAVPVLATLMNCLRVASKAQLLVTGFADPADVAQGLKPCRIRLGNFLSTMALDGEVFEVGEAKRVEGDVYVFEVELRHVPIQPVAIGVKPE